MALGDWLDNPLGGGQAGSIPLLGGAWQSVWGSGAGVSQTPTPQADPALYQYGGTADGAARQAGVYGNRAAGALGRSAPVADFGMANADYAAQLQARGQQQGLADQYGAFLRGEKASLAGLQQQQGAAQAQQAAANMAANARGDATSLALAQRDAARAQMTGMQASNMNAAQLRAQEEATARGQLAGLLGDMRGGDFTARGGSQQQTGMLLQNEQWNRDSNDKTAQGWAGLENDVNKSQLAAGTSYGNAQLGAQASVAAGNAEIRQQNRKNESLVGRAGGVIGGLLGGG